MLYDQVRMGYRFVKLPTCVSTMDYKRNPICQWDSGKQFSDTELRLRGMTHFCQVRRLFVTWEYGAESDRQESCG